jgi:hypothetical protein
VPVTRRTPLRGRPCGRSRAVERHDRLGRADIRHERRQAAGPQGTEDRANLRLPTGDTDADGDLWQVAGVECDRPCLKLVGQEAPVDVERGDEELADGGSRFQIPARFRTERRLAPRRPADAERGDVEPAPQVEDPAQAVVGVQRRLRCRIVDQARGEEAERRAADSVGHSPERFAGRAAEPVAAAEREHRCPGLVGWFVEGVGDGGNRRPVSDPDDGSIADGRPEDLGAEPPDHAPADILRPGDGGCEMDGVEAEAPAELVGGRRGFRRSIDDPDLDDALGAGTLEQPRDLGPGDAEQLRNARLRLAELVVEPARPNQLLEVAQPVSAWRGCTFARYRCAAHHRLRRSGCQSAATQARPGQSARGPERETRSGPSPADPTSNRQNGSKAPWWVWM